MSHKTTIEGLVRLWQCSTPHYRCSMLMFHDENEVREVLKELKLDVNIIAAIRKEMKPV